MLLLYQRVSLDTETDYCINEYHWTPSQYAKLSLKEKALVQATIDIRVEAEDKARKEAEREAKRNR